MEIVTTWYGISAASKILTDSLQYFYNLDLSKAKIEFADLYTCPSSTDEVVRFQEYQIWVDKVNSVVEKENTEVVTESGKKSVFSLRK
jgi:hypothetical protein